MKKSLAGKFPARLFLFELYELAAILLVGQRFFLLGDHFTLLRFVSVHLSVFRPFVGNVVFVEDRFDGAFGNTRFAIDAFFGVDVKHLLTLVKAFDGADDNAICIFATEARLSYYMSHS